MWIRDEVNIIIVIVHDLKVCTDLRNVWFNYPLILELTNDEDLGGMVMTLEFVI